MSLTVMVVSPFGIGGSGRGVRSRGYGLLSVVVVLIRNAGHFPEHRLQTVGGLILTRVTVSVRKQLPRYLPALDDSLTEALEVAGHPAECARRCAGILTGTSMCGSGHRCDSSGHRLHRQVALAQPEDFRRDGQVAQQGLHALNRVSGMGRPIG